jgi:hypothetical protein
MSKIWRKVVFVISFILISNRTGVPTSLRDATVSYWECLVWLRIIVAIAQPIISVEAGFPGSVGQQWCLMVDWSVG